jgi:peroxiredoxin
LVLAGAWEKPNTHAGLPGSPAAAFRLPDLDGKIVSLGSMSGSVIVLCFAPAPESNPANQDVRRLAELGRRYAAENDVKLVTIYSGADDLAAEQMRLVQNQASDAGPRCITLLDPSLRIAQRYCIQQTPTFLIIDAAGVIRYRGGVDDPSLDAPLAATSFTSLIDLLLAEKPLPDQPTPAVLSNIK